MVSSIKVTKCQKNYSKSKPIKAHSIITKLVDETFFGMVALFII